MPWKNQRPESLVDKSTPGELLRDIRSEAVIVGDALTALDFVLRQWTLVAISRSSDVQGLLALDELAATGLRKLVEGPETATTRARWGAFRDLLESKRLAIGGAQSGRARNLLHAQPILERLQNGELMQSALRKAVGLSAPRLSQVLAVMEEGGLIRREKRGKENVVSLAARVAPESTTALPMSTGRLVFGRSAA